MRFHRVIHGIFQILKEDYGLLEAKMIAGKAQGRYLGLCRENKDDSKQKRAHTFSRIYPCIAMYQTLRAHGLNPEQAQYYIHEYFQRFSMKLVPLMQWSASLPHVAENLPSLFMKISKMAFPPEAGFSYEFPEHKENQIRFNITRCPYMDACMKYQCPEICRAFCDSDDTAYGNLHPSLHWKRTQTIGRGAEYCDFMIEYEKETNAS